MNKKIGFLIVILILLSANVFCFVLGDVNFDGKVTKADAELVGQWFTSQKTLTTLEKNAADVDCNGWVNVYDVQYLYRYLAKDITVLPGKTN